MYFPTTAIVSLMFVMEYGASAEIAVVGNEGFLGVPLFMGGETTPSRAVVQSAGYGYRLKAALLKQDIAMTQELIANMLGVRRESETEVAGNFQREGIIRYIRGRITVLSRHRLEQTVCECYAVVKKEYDRLLPPLG